MIMNSKERHERRFERRKALREKKKQNLNTLFGDFDKIFTFDNMYDAFKKCCKGVGWKSSTQGYRNNALFNINKTLKELHSGKFRSRGFYEFDIFERGKPRHIRSVHISERVVQRCLCDNALVPILKNGLIYDNGASMKGKGIDFTLNRLNCHLQRHYKQYGHNGYVLLIDYSKYFDRILHELLIEELKTKISDPRLLKVVTDFVDDFGDVGLGLGSQISQICALTFPNHIDHFIKEQLGIKGYARYMDDSYLIHPSKEYLQYCLTEIKKKCDELGIVMNPRKTRIIKLSRGMTFLKTRFIIAENGKIIRQANKKTINRMRRKLKTFARWSTEGRMAIEDIRVSYTSWKGHLMRCNSNRTVRKMDRLFEKYMRELQDNKQTS